MLYRPDSDLERLRQNSGTFALPWLRTLVLLTPPQEIKMVNEETIHILPKSIIRVERVVRPARLSAGDEESSDVVSEEEEDEEAAWYTMSACAVERVQLKGFDQSQLLSLLPVLTHSIMKLNALDIRGCLSVSDDFLLGVGSAHPYLQRLYLPPKSDVAQETLNLFTKLEELDASHCHSLRNVDFCSSTLRVLYASPKLKSEGVHQARKLEVLALSLKDGADISFCASDLLELYVLDCGNEWCKVKGLNDLTRIQVLRGLSDHFVKTLQAHQLTKLRETDVDLVKLSSSSVVRKLVSATVFPTAPGILFSEKVPVGDALRHLYFFGNSFDLRSCFQQTRNLVFLQISVFRGNDGAPLVPGSVLELVAGSPVDDRTIADAAKKARIMYLDVAYNKQVTTVAPLSASLRHLVCNLDVKEVNAWRLGSGGGGSLVTLNGEERARERQTPLQAKSRVEIRN